MNTAHDFNVRLKSNGNYWQVVWTLPDGNTKGASLGPKRNLSERQARSRCREMAYDLSTGKAWDGNGVCRLSEWIDKYVYLRPELSPLTVLEIRQTGRYLLEWFEDDPQIDTITQLQAAEWRAALAAGKLQAAGRHRKPDAELKPDTVARAYRSTGAASGNAPRVPSEATLAKHVRTAKRMFAEAAAKTGVGLIDANPFARMSGRAPKAKREWRDVPMVDLLRILDACPNDAWRAMFALARLAGLRRGECLNLQWGDIDFAANKIHVNARLEKETTKKARRVLPIEPARCPTGLTAMLHEWKAETADDDSLVCPGITVSVIDSKPIEVLRKSGVGRYPKPFHALRKCRSVELAAAYPQHVLCEWMGHDVEVSQEFYLRVGAELFTPPLPTPVDPSSPTS